MPIPLIPFLVVAVVAALGVTFLLKKNKGKIIYIAGYNGAGKNVLSYFLGYNKKPSAIPRQPTNADEIVPIDKFSKNNKVEYIKTIINARHHDKKSSDYEKETENIRKTYYTFYLFDVNEFLAKDDYARKCIDELDLFIDLCKQNNKKISIIGTHLDLIQGFCDSKSLEQYSPLIEKIKKNENILKIYDMHNEGIFYVALTDKYIEESVKPILNSLQPK